MPIDDADIMDGLAPRDIGRYAGLGLVTNPFVAPADRDDDPGVQSEIAAAGNILLKAIIERAAEPAPRPLVVLKGEVPAQYALLAMGSAEPYLATDEGMGVLYAYVPLFSMRSGTVRATLSVVAERLAFRDFDVTLAAYLRQVLAEPDTALAAYPALDLGALDRFAHRLEQDPSAAVAAVFGEGELDLHPELSQVADLRLADLMDDGDESDAAPELDGSVGDSPGAAALAAGTEQRLEQEDRALFDYFTEYTAAHLSPVIARSLRVYRDRGLAAFASELRITKAPRKTLAAILRLASVRFRKTAFIYDGFDNWLDIPEDTRSSIVGALSELRWKSAGSAFPVFILGPGDAPEIEETFGAAATVSWDFPGLVPMQEEPGSLLPAVVKAWLEAAMLPGRAPLSMDEGVLASLAEGAEGSMNTFVRRASAAVESAADRGVATLDPIAEQAGLAAEL